MSAVCIRPRHGGNGTNVSWNKVLIVMTREKQYTYGVESK
jgi:hypothetical protein